MTGAELRAVRQALGWSQATLAQRLGVPIVTIYRWERGAVLIRHGEILKLALEWLQEHESARSKEPN